MSKTNSRANKWRSYREEIDSSKNIDFSIVNSDKNIKKMLNSIDCDIEKLYKKVGYTKEKKDENALARRDDNDINEIAKLIETIDNNEVIKNRQLFNTGELNSPKEDKLNSHKYDEYINEYFLEFKSNRKNIDIIGAQETTDLKISKIKKSDKNE